MTVVSVDVVANMVQGFFTEAWQGQLTIDRSDLRGWHIESRKRTGSQVQTE